jgi:hypothetical protein
VAGQRVTIRRAIIYVVSGIPLTVFGYFTKLIAQRSSSHRVSAEEKAS